MSDLKALSTYNIYEIIHSTLVKFGLSNLCHCDQWGKNVISRLFIVAFHFGHHLKTAFISLSVNALDFVPIFLQDFGFSQLALSIDPSVFLKIRPL